ncbi:MAG: AAA family ATPase [Legionellaceae bacterium]|nr:AAA family ATPase [Legionellaceae bacterium]
MVEKDFWGEQWRDMQNAYFQEHNIDLSVDLNHVIPEQHRGRQRQPQSHYLREENQHIDEVRRDISRGQVGVFIKYLSTKHSVFTRRDVEKLLFKTFRNSDDTQEYLRVMERILGHKEIVFLGKNERGHDSFTTRAQYRLEARLHKDVEALMTRRQHVKDYFEAQQQYIIGASLSGKVAKALQTETGIPSSTIASLMWKISNDRLKLTDKHVLVVDEAGMVDVHNMAFLLRTARKASSKVVLIGDPEQLKPIHKGEIFRGVAALTGYIELENIKRQQNAGDRQASRNLARGRIQEAVQHYHDKQAVIISEHAINNLLNDRDKALHTEAVRDTVLLAFSRNSVRELNVQARKRLQVQNKIGHENITFQGFERELNISTGDRLLFRENNKVLGLRNGDIGTVKQVHQSGYHVELDSGEQVDVPREYQAMDYGYALTVHKSQGMTTKHAKVLIDSKYWDRNLSFVAFTRHKESLKFTPIR